MTFQCMLYSPAALSLLQTNNVPTAREEIILRASLFSAQAILCALDEDLRRLLAPRSGPVSASSTCLSSPASWHPPHSSGLSLAGLSAQLVQEVVRSRYAVQQFIDVHLNILSPVRRLPVELMQLIFLYGMEDTEGDAEIDMIAPPWVYTHVCSRWRAVAASFSALWCNISAYAGGDGTLTALHTMLQRSNRSPLSVFFSWNGKSADNDVLSILRPHAPRWRKLTLCIPHPAFLVLPQAPSLDEFTLHTASGRFCRDFLGSWLMYSPKLRVVKIPEYTQHHYQWNGHLQIPWSQLTSFSYDSTVLDRDLGKQIEILQRLEHLERLELSCGYCAYPVQNLKQITLQHLESIIINPYDIESLLNNIVAPSLKDITILCRSANSSINIGCLAALIIRSDCRPTRLVVKVWAPQLRVTEDEEREIGRLLNACSSLEVLYLGLGELTAKANIRRNRILENTIVDQQRTPGVSLLSMLGRPGTSICPRLRELDVHVIGGTAWETCDFTQVMQNILEYRPYPGVLKSLRVLHVGGISYSDDPHVARAREELLAFGHGQKGANVAVSWP